MPSEVGQEFGDPAGYPYMAVCSPSCHDTSTTRAWFEDNDGRRERFCSEMLGVHVRFFIPRNSLVGLFFQQFLSGSCDSIIYSL